MSEVVTETATAETVVVVEVNLLKAMERAYTRKLIRLMIVWVASMMLVVGGMTIALVQIEQAAADRVYDECRLRVERRTDDRVLFNALFALVSPEERVEPQRIVNTLRPPLNLRTVCGDPP